VQLHLLFIVVHAMHVCPDVHLIFLGSGATTSFGTAPGFCFARETNCYPVRQATAREDRVRLGQLRSIDGRMDEPAQHDTNLIGHATIWARHGLARSVNRAVPLPWPKPDMKGARSCWHDRPERIVQPHAHRPPRASSLLVDVQVSSLPAAPVSAG
jgi:hypothetical protein